MQLLQLLSDGAFHSGAALGQQLGVSRTAIWKQIHRWQEKGQYFDVVPGKGYRWRNPVEWWSESALLSFMSPAARAALSSLQIDASVASTNTLALERVTHTLQSGCIFMAEEQTAGRGRRGRQWLGALGGGLYASVTWVFDDGVSALEGLSLAVGLVVANALQRYGVTGVGLKWPNDIMIGDAKLGGILIEMQIDGEGRSLVVVGIGLNLCRHVALDGLARDVAAVQDGLSGRQVERNRIAAMVLGDTLELLGSYRAGSFAVLKQQWCDLDVLAGQSVVLENGLLVGIGRGVDDRGALLVEVEGAIKAISSGEVSLRRA